MDDLRNGSTVTSNFFLSAVRTVKDGDKPQFFQSVIVLASSTSSRPVLGGLASRRKS
jgi:hypothetical protein